VIDTVPFDLENNVHISVSVLDEGNLKMFGQRRATQANGSDEVCRSSRQENDFVDVRSDVIEGAKCSAELDECVAAFTTPPFKVLLDPFGIRSEIALFQSIYKLPKGGVPERALSAVAMQEATAVGTPALKVLHLQPGLLTALGADICRSNQPAVQDRCLGAFRCPSGRCPLRLIRVAKQRGCARVFENCSEKTLDGTLG